MRSNAWRLTAFSFSQSGVFQTRHTCLSKRILYSGPAAAIIKLRRRVYDCMSYLRSIPKSEHPKDGKECFMMNNLEFIDFLKQALAKPVMYMWGDFGRPITESTISTKAKQYPQHYDAAYQAELRKQIGTGIGCDCTGLIKWFLWTGGDIEKVPKYDAATDNSAGGWYRSAKVRGEIGAIPETQGLIVSMYGHCGVYIGEGKVIECTKSVLGNGVIMTNLTDHQWEYWCECANIDYQVTDEVPEGDGYYDIQYKAVGVVKDCPAWSALNKRQKIGTVYKEDEILYLGDFGGMCVIIYPTSASKKTAFIEKSNVIFPKENEV